MKPTNFRTYEMAIKLFKLCQKMKAKSYIQDQLCRAALSVCLNLVEGAAKPTRADKKRFYAIAYGSIREVQAILRIVGQPEVFDLADQIGGSIYRLIQGTD